MNLVPKPRLVAYALFALVVFGVGVASWSGRLDGEPGGRSVVVTPGEPSPESPGSGSTVPLSPTSTSTEALMYVHVAGAVRSPGVYRLPVGSRVFEALEAAGGALADATAEQLPLAAPLTDGSRIEVPREGEVAAGAVSAGSSLGAGPSAAPGPVSLNRATAEELETLPGIGPKTAASIIAFREEQGAFEALEDLTLVSGIGPATFERVRDLITL